MANQLYIQVAAETHAENKHPAVPLSEGLEKELKKYNNIDGLWTEENPKILVQTSAGLGWKIPDNLVNAYNQLAVELSDTIPTVETSKVNTIYLVPKEAAEQVAGNKYHEYIVIEKNGVKQIEYIGLLDGQFAKPVHSHGNINNDGQITAESVIEANDKLLISDANDNNSIKASVSFDGNESKFLTSAGSFKNIVPSDLPYNDLNKAGIVSAPPINGKINHYMSDINGNPSWTPEKEAIQIENDHSLIGFLGNVKVNVPNTAQEISGYILSGGVNVISSVNTDILQFNINRKSIEDMYNLRIDKSATNFHINLSVPLKPSYGYYPYIEARIVIDIANLRKADDTIEWDTDKFFTVQMTRCIAHLYDIAYDGIRSEHFDYISGLHTGCYGSYDKASSSNPHYKYGLIKDINNTYSRTSYYQWSLENSSLSAQTNVSSTNFLRMIDGFNFLKEDGNGNPLTLHSKLYTNVFSGFNETNKISNSNKTPARLFVYYK